MIQSIHVFLTGLTIACLPFVAAAQSTHSSFETMAQPTDEKVACKAPKPPKDLAETAYIRNGYRAILRIMAAEKWQETGSCDCFLAVIKWEEVLEAGPTFQSSDDPKRPFDTSVLRERADDLLAERDAACAN